MPVLVSSSFLIGQPELISPALGSSGHDWVGFNPPPNTPPYTPLSLSLESDNQPPSSPQDSLPQAPCSDSPRAQSGEHTVD